MADFQVTQDNLPEQGEWVKIWALVKNPRPHPDEIMVRFESHNEHYNGLVRHADVMRTDETPEHAEQCTRLGKVNEGLYVRCTGHDGHPGTHGDPRSGIQWSERETVGFFEEA